MSLLTETDTFDCLQEQHPELVAVDSMGIVGTLRFLGEAEFKEGYWAGIQLDIVGSGKNDGSVKGYVLSTCSTQ